MTRLTASQARIPPDCFNRVAYQGEIASVERRDARVYIISEKDYQLLDEAKQARAGRLADISRKIRQERGDLLRRLAE